jgi:hypothetical protein
MMTPAQLATLKADIKAAADLAAPLAAAQAQSIADAYNATASPAVLLWRPDIGVDELRGAVVWSDFVALTTVRQQAYLALTQGVTIDATKASVRGAFAAIFGAGSASLTALTALAQRPATRLEALFTVAVVSSMYGQRLTPQDVAAAAINDDGTTRA